MPISPLGAARSGVRTAHVSRRRADRSDSQPPRLASTNLTRAAYERIRRAIVCGQLDLGEALSEQDLADGLGMSKAPIRMALTELRVKGLVVTIPRSGTYVFTPTEAEIEALCDFRYWLEAQALRQSMGKLRVPFLEKLRRAVVEMKKAIQSNDALGFKKWDTEFHHAFVHHCGNHYLISSYETISDVVEALRYRCVDPIVLQNRAFVEHQKILGALEGSRVEKAVSVLRAHIARGKQRHAVAQGAVARKRRKDYRFRDYSGIF
jgi:DNA-binding GntR family transcriptional regulator